MSFERVAVAEVLEEGREAPEREPPKLSDVAARNLDRQRFGA
jgi:hypothetical protein